MAALTTVAQNAILNKLFLNTGVLPTDWWYGLFTSVQNTEQDGTECPDTAYARQPVTFNSPVDGVITNDGQVTFPPMDASQDIVAVGLFDDETAGDCWLFQNLNNPVTIGIAEQARVVDMGQLVSVV